MTIKQFILLALLITGFKSNSQTIPVGFPVIEQYLRREQLMNDNPNRSFCLRPIYVGKTDSLLNSSISEYFSWAENIFLPLQVNLEYNSHHPYPSLNGSMIPNRGTQTKFSFGLHGQNKFIHLQLRPDVVYSQNLDFETFPKNGGRHIYLWWNYSDVPQKFGENRLYQLQWGQTFLNFNYRKISFGASSQNIWWGPGKYDALLMTNNAQGFNHLTLHSNEPINLGIGYLEFQFVAGILKNSGLLPDTSINHFQTDLYVAKSNESRYLNGISMTFQPKIVPGLFVGFNSSVQQYLPHAQRKKNYLPIIKNTFQEKRISDAVSFENQLTSIHARYQFRDSEVYFEYGRNNASWQLRHLLENIKIDGATVIGFSHIFRTKSNWSVETDVEFTQLQQPPGYLLKSNAKSWYIDKNIRHGYTHNGQVIGSSIGLGSNRQLARISFINGFNRIGIQLERLVNNNDFYYYHYSFQGFYQRYWVDYTIGLSASWKLEDFLFDLEIKRTKSLNYQWQALPGPWFEPGVDPVNFFGRINLAYIF